MESAICCARLAAPPFASIIRVGGSHGSRFSGFSLSKSGHNSTKPGSRLRAAMCSMGPEPRPFAASDFKNTWSTRLRTDSVDRKEMFRPISANVFPAAETRPAMAVRIRENSSGAARWKLKIDCFSSPTAKTVRSISSLAPLPLKNSAHKVSMISHCSGLVSCASSIRMWSIP